jgi:hypothetical protein
VEVLDVGPDHALTPAIDPRPALLSAGHQVELCQRGANGVLEFEAPAVTDGHRPQVHERA